mmetsp:Transcript_15148/g.36977  ORF Transcript_15148/g.36977 Transcript_15148/m.36977 type:complete len:611 (+) Transcript_15148:93-1925(+)
MFWRLGYSHSSPVDTLLEGGDFTLQQLLEEQDIIQECKQLNKKLIDYLAVPEQVKALIEYVVVEQPADSEDKDKFIYPYKASEVLASDLNAVYDCLFANDELIDKLFSFLELEAPLNALLAGYFGKIVSTLLARRPEETFRVIESKRVVPQLLRHLNTFSVLELLLKVVSEVEESVSPVLEFEWLYKIGLVEQLIGKLSQDLDSEVHANASIALVSFVSSRSQSLHWQSASLSTHQSRFAADLLAPASVSALLDRTLDGTASTLQHGLTVLVELVRHCTNGARAPGETQPVISELARRLDRLVVVLREPPPMAPITNTTGTLDPPLGSNRLKILEVVQELVRLKDPAVNARMVELRVLPAVLNLLFKYEWHTFLHNLVRGVVDEVLTGGSEPFKVSLFRDGEILERIIDAHAANDEHAKQPKACRKGYMGQLRLISNTVMQQAGLEAWMREYTERDAWRAFVSERLEPSNELNDRHQLGAAKSGGNSHSDDQDFSSPPQSGAADFGGGLQFRANEQDNDLFGHDNDEYDGDDVELGGNDMDVDASEEAEADPQTDQLSHDFGSAMHVDANAPEAGQGQGDDGVLPDSPDYNDINFWKPKMNWYNPEDDTH